MFRRDASVLMLHIHSILERRYKHTDMGMPGETGPGETIMGGIWKFEDWGGGSRGLLGTGCKI